MHKYFRGLASFYKNKNNIKLIMIAFFKTFYFHLKNKTLFTNVYPIISKIFNRSNLNKAVIIFTFGLISRIFILNFFKINVFTDYLHYISLSYYSIFSLFIVLIHEVVNYFNINIIPGFVSGFYSHLLNLFNININILKNIFNTLKSPLYLINIFKWEDLKLSSIRIYIKSIITQTSNSKITMGSANSKPVSIKMTEPKAPIIPNALNMDGDFNLYDSDRNSSDISSLNSRPASSNDANNTSSLTPFTTTNNTPVKPRATQSAANNNPNNKALLFKVDTIKENSDVESLAIQTPSNSDAHSIASQEKVYTNLTYRPRAPMPSGFTTPDTMSPLFGNSRNPSIEYANTPDLTPCMSYHSTKVIVGLNASNEGIWRSRFPSESDIQATDWTQRRQIAEYNMRQQNIDYYGREIAPNLTDVVLPEEVEVKRGIFGKIKLAFNLIDSKLEAKISNMDSIAIKYHDSSKRKFFWTIWEKKSGNYESYEDFKQSWDPKTNIWKEIKSRTNNDVRVDVEGILGVGRNRNQIHSAPTRAIQGRNANISIGVNELIRERQPFKYTQLNTEEKLNTVENNETPRRRHKSHSRSHHKHSSHGHSRRHPKQ